MEYQRIEQGGEIVLTYCPEKQVEAIEFRYERELPERMRKEGPAVEIAAAEKPAAERVVRVADELTAPKRAKPRTALTLATITLCFLMAFSCIGVGIWSVIDSFRDWVVITPDIGGNPNNNGGQNEQPDGDEQQRPDRDEDVTPNNTGEPKIEVYRPAEGTPGLQLVSVSPGRKQLSAEEIYTKVAPSTVTILGVYEETYSVGTGVIFSSDGYIVTNYHVIAGCLDCEVWVTNEYGVDSVYKALMVGGDDEKDLAVLKIDAVDLPAAEFGVSSDLVVGDKVYAIGNPLGTELRSTFTDGIVSAVDRNVDVDGITMTLIQTNTALNSGNSGGPLVNAYGQVIGINTIKMMSGYDTIEGLGFAIPTSHAQRWVDDILTLGEIRPTPILGVSVNRIPVKLEDGTVGLEVLEVTRGLGAQRAGVQVGDVVVAFNGVPISRVEHIYAQRIKLAVGDSVVIRVYRNGEYLDLTMILMAQPEN